MLHRLTWHHAIPVVLLLGCLLSTYLLAAKLAADISESENAGSNKITSASSSVLSLPHSLEDARVLSLRLTHYLHSHPSSHILVILLFMTVYILKQTFSIPGSGLLNLMSGFIFGSAVGVPLVAFLTAVGASGCYWLSYYIGGEIVSRISSIQKRVDSMSRIVEHEKANGNLFFYLLTIRVFPFTPNYFVNLASPLVQVPFTTFFATCAIGLVPYTFITVGAGETLYTMSMMQQKNNTAAGHQQQQILTVADIFDAWTAVKLVLLACCLLTPTILKRFVLKKDAQLKL